MTSNRGRGVLEKLFGRLCRKFNATNRVLLLKSSDDPGLAEYLDAIDALGSTHMDEDGLIFVKIHDLRRATKATWLEEMAHALQYLKTGNVELSQDNAGRNHRESEVAVCLLNRADKIEMSDDDLAHYKKAMQVYGGASCND